MTNHFLNILLIEDFQQQADLIQAKLDEVEDACCQVTWVQRLCDGLENCRNHYFDVILLDLTLPDSDGLDTLLHLKTQVPYLPILVLTVSTDRTLAIDAVRQGAEDFLIKGHQLTGDWLVRAINYAIERHQIKAELQAQKAELQTQIERERLMGRMIERIRQSLELNEILKTTVEEVRQFLKTDRVLIYRCQEHWNGEIIAESKTTEGENIVNTELDNALAVLRTLSLNPDSNVNQEISNAAEIDTLIASLVNAVFTVPIWQNPTPQKTYLWGQLIAHDYSGLRQWQEWEIEFLTNLGNQVAIAIKQSELYEEVARQATLDGLTGIANRRQFDYVLDKEWQRLRRDGKPLSLIMCDVDFFTLYNKTYGHLGGDECLKQIAQVLAQVSQRSSDLAARYGGEEFAIILPDTNTEGALTVARNIQNSLHNLRIPHRKSTVNDFVTLSIGIATCFPHNSGESCTLIVEMADIALFQAKEEGRNRIIYY